MVASWKYSDILDAIVVHWFFLVQYVFYLF